MQRQVEIPFIALGEKVIAKHHFLRFFIHIYRGDEISLFFSRCKKATAHPNHGAVVEKNPSFSYLMKLAG